MERRREKTSETSRLTRVGLPVLVLKPSRTAWGTYLFALRTDNFASGDSYALMYCTPIGLCVFCKNRLYNLTALCLHETLPCADFLRFWPQAIIITEISCITFSLFVLINVEMCDFL